MKQRLFLPLLMLTLFSTWAHAGLLDNIIKVISQTPSEGTDEGTIASGLKEAPSIGTENAVKNVSQVDGLGGIRLNAGWLCPIILAAPTVFSNGGGE
jgi:hypothetical protein